MTENQQTKKEDYNIGNVVNAMNEEDKGVHISLMRANVKEEETQKVTHYVSVESDMSYAEIKEVLYNLHKKMEEEEQKFQESKGE